MKRLFGIICATMFTVALAGSAWATPVSFVEFMGRWSYSSTGLDSGTINFLDIETINLRSPGLGDGIYVDIHDIDINTNKIGNEYAITNTPIDQGFTIWYDHANYGTIDAGEVLLQATLDVKKLGTSFGNADISPYLEISLTNIVVQDSADSVWGNAGLSNDVLYLFRNTAGDIDISLTLSSGDDFDIAISGGSGNGTMDGNISPVPEPATMLLLGSGLIGMIGFKGKKSSQS